MAVCSGSIFSSVPVGRQAQPGAGLLQGGLGLLDPQLEVGLVELGDRLALANPGAQVDVDPLDPAGNLGAERDLVLGRQGAGGRHRPRQGALGGGDDPDLARQATRRSRSPGGFGFSWERRWPGARPGRPTGPRARTRITIKVGRTSDS